MKIVLMLIGVMVLSRLPAWAKPPPPVESVEIRKEGLWVNGEPFFAVGIGWVAHWHFRLPEAGEKGFNCVVTSGLRADPQTFRADIDDAYANGMYALASLSNGVWQDLERVEQIVIACRDAPGLLVWELEDEPNHPNNPYRIPPEKFKPVYDLIKRLDPVHPVWLNLACGRLKDHQDYRDVADIHSDDVYPVPHSPLAHVAQYSDRVVEGAAGKPGWMWVQMAPLHGDYLNEDDRAPTMTEVRCMTYMAVAHGISGVAYFSFHYNGEHNGEAWEWWVDETAPAYWAQWADLTTELRCLAPYLLAPEVPGELEAEIIEGSKEPANFGYTALHLSLRQTDSGYFLIAVNGFNSPIKALFTVPVPVSGIAPHAAVRFENRLVEVAEGVFEDSFAPYAVHLYELPFAVDGTQRETISWPRWQRRARR